MKLKTCFFDPQSPYFDGAVGVYVESTGAEPASARRFFIQYATTKADYIGLVAIFNEQVVGVAFGTRSAPGDWWHDRVAAAVGGDHPALQDAWVLTELHVKQGFRNRGTGTTLHNQIIRQQPYPNLLLSTGAANTGAQRLYRRLGWRYLYRNLFFRQGTEPFMVMFNQRPNDDFADT